ncbi:hypothetical protein QOZ73_32790, partial [Pseudomonas aeruginosa]|uniref:hypothetical protein n=1 Tax=Pseudomonas aeruginosa TaxID=287 RepID=UPI00345A75A5
RWQVGAGLAERGEPVGAGKLLCVWEMTEYRGTYARLIYPTCPSLIADIGAYPPAGIELAVFRAFKCGHHHTNRKTGT